MDKTFNVDFYFGDVLNTPIRQFTPSVLSGFKKYLRNIFIGPIIMQKGLLPLLFDKQYKSYLITGETRNLTLWLFLLLAKVFNKEVSLWTHGYYGKERGSVKHVKRLFYKLADHVFLYGNHARKLMINDGFPEKKLSCIYNSLDYKKQALIRENISNNSPYTDYFKNNNPVICYIGRVQRIKKIEHIFKALEILRERGEYINFVLIGGGEYLDTIKKTCISESNRDSVWLYGPSYVEEVNAKLLFYADLCVSPGNVGLTAIHAMMYGCPVITNNNFQTQMPEFEIIEEGRTGDFFVENDVVDLANVIENWLGMYEKASFAREAIRKSCYRKADEKYNPFFQIKLLKKVFYEYTTNK